MQKLLMLTFGKTLPLTADGSGWRSVSLHKPKLNLKVMSGPMANMRIKNCGKSEFQRRTTEEILIQWD